MIDLPLLSKQNPEVLEVHPSEALRRCRGWRNPPVALLLRFLAVKMRIDCGVIVLAAEVEAEAEVEVTVGQFRPHHSLVDYLPVGCQN
jgi:hypothetical protein